MNEYVLVCHGLAAGPPDHDIIGQYLEWYDPEAFDGRGDAVWTLDLSKAKRFPSFFAAMEEWRRVPEALPVRPDGKANRPLTSFSVEPRKVSRETSAERRGDG